MLNYLDELYTLFVFHLHDAAHSFMSNIWVYELMSKRNFEVYSGVEWKICGEGSDLGLLFCCSLLSFVYLFCFLYMHC